MDIIIASNNVHKVDEIRQILKGKFDNIYSLKDKMIDIEIEENGKTFYDNALIKASTIVSLSGLPTLADDSGLEVDALNGAPGVYSARYAGEKCDDNANNAKLLAQLEGITNRSARFVCNMILCYPDGKIVSAAGITEGYILESPRGNSGFGYDPLFFSKDLEKSFGIASNEEKNSVSHRGRALQELVQKLNTK